MNDMKEKAMGAVKAFLERKGYEIVDEAWQGPEGIGGIDLVAVDEDGTLVFVDATVRIGTDGFPEAHRARGLREALGRQAPTRTPTGYLRTTWLGQTEEKNRAESLSRSRPANPRVSNWLHYSGLLSSVIDPGIIRLL